MECGFILKGKMTKWFSVRMSGFLAPCNGWFYIVFHILNEIINLAKNIKISGPEVSISSLIPRGDRLSEKGKKVNKELEEKCTAENFAFIVHKNINRS